MSLVGDFSVFVVESTKALHLIVFPLSFIVPSIFKIEASVAVAFIIPFVAFVSASIGDIFLGEL
jgi:hypothetical protein